jgi:hypothetical protein
MPTECFILSPICDAIGTRGVLDELSNCRVMSGRRQICNLPAMVRLLRSRLFSATVNIFVATMKSERWALPKVEHVIPATSLRGCYYHHFYNSGNSRAMRQLHPFFKAISRVDGEPQLGNLLHSSGPCVRPKLPVAS